MAKPNHPRRTWRAVRDRLRRRAHDEAALIIRMPPPAGGDLPAFTDPACPGPWAIGYLPRSRYLPGPPFAADPQTWADAHRDRDPGRYPPVIDALATRHAGRYPPDDPGSTGAQIAAAARYMTGQYRDRTTFPSGEYASEPARAADGIAQAPGPVTCAWGASGIACAILGHPGGNTVTEHHGHSPDEACPAGLGAGPGWAVDVAAPCWDAAGWDAAGATDPDQDADPWMAGFAPIPKAPPPGGAPCAHGKTGCRVCWTAHP